MLNFPTSPATNDVFTSGTNSWRFDGTKWLPVLALERVEGLPAALSARTPVGTTGAVQFNGGGFLSGAPNVAIDAGDLLLQATSEPAAAASGVKVYAREIVPGHTALKVLRPSGVDSPLQDGIAFNRFVKYQGGSAAVIAIGGGGLTAAPAGGVATIAPGSQIVTSLPRTQYTTAATAAAIASLYSVAMTTNYAYRGGVAGQGGFRVVFRWATSALVASQSRFFIGLRDSVNVPTNVDPFTSTAPGVVGVALNLATDSNYRVVHNLNGAAPTVINMGSNFASSQDLMELVLFCPPNLAGTARPVSYRLRRYTTSADPVFETTGSLSTNLPAGATALVPTAWVVNGPTAAAAASFQINSITVESDT